MIHRASPLVYLLQTRGGKREIRKRDTREELLREDTDERVSKRERESNL